MTNPLKRRNGETAKRRVLLVLVLLLVIVIDSANAQAPRPPILSLSGLTNDVSISSPTDDQPLVYDSATGKWGNSSTLDDIILQSTSLTGTTANFGTAKLIHPTGGDVVDWSVANKIRILEPIVDGSGNSSLDTNTRQLIGNDGTTVKFQWDGMGVRFPALTTDGVLTTTGGDGTVGVSTSAPFPIPVGATVYVDQTNGDDGTGLRGRRDKPYATISAAIVVAQSGDVLLVGPGTFTENGGIQLPSKVSLVGAGADVTVIESSLSSTSSNKAIVAPGNDALLSDFTVKATAADGLPLGIYTSNTVPTGTITIYRVHVLANGQADAFYLNGSVAATWRLYSCVLETKGDGVFATTSAGNVVELYDCSIICDGQATYGTVRGIINSGSGTVRMYGGLISAKNGVGITTGVRNEAFGVVSELWNVRLDTSSSSGSVLDITGGAASTTNISGVARSDGTPLTVQPVVKDLSRLGAKVSVTSTVDQTATTETAHITYTVPANSVSAGTTFRIAAWGNTDSGSSITITPSFRWGGTAGVQLLAGPAFTTGIAQANKDWKLEGYVTVRTTGAIGTAMATVAWESFNSNAYVSNMKTSGGTAVTIDTTANKDLVLTFTLSATTGTPHVRTFGGTIEVVKP